VDYSGAETARLKEFEIRAGRRRASSRWTARRARLRLYWRWV